MTDVDKSAWVWLEHPESGGKAQFPPQAAGLWRAKGWIDTEAPPEPNVLKDPIPESELVPINEPVTAPVQAETPSESTPATAGAKNKESSRG